MFTEHQLRDLAFDYADGWTVLHEESTGKGRWIEHIFVVTQNDSTKETIGFTYGRPLTELQEHEFYEQPVPVESYEEVIPERRVTKWRKKHQ